MSEDYYDEDDQDYTYSSRSDDGEECKTYGQQVEEETEEVENEEEKGECEHHSGGDRVSFTGGWDCTCSGSCLCRYYEPKSTYNSDCFYCGHPLSSHRKR